MEKLYEYFNKLKDQLDLNILHKFLSTLKQVEEGKLDQHEASVKVGQALKNFTLIALCNKETSIRNKT